jgi:type III secretion system YscQ/HrcQ family protein
MNSRALQRGDLPAIGAEAATAHRRLLRSPHPHLQFSPPVAAMHPQPGWWLVLAMGNSTVQLQMPACAWPDWHPGQTGSDVPEALLAAGIAQIGAPLWQAMTQATGVPVQLLRARWLSEAPAPPADALAWQLKGSAWHGTLHLGSSTAWQHFAAALPEPTPVPALPSDFGQASTAHCALRVPVVLDIGCTRLPVVDLARLRRHAVLLIDAPTFAVPPRGNQRAHAVRVLAGATRLCVAHALWQPPALLRRQAPPATSLQGETMSNHDTAAPASTDAASLGADALDIGAVEVQVRFELARQHWPLAHLAQWRVGQALALDAPLADAVVSAWVHERCVASGRLVVIGDKLGLRIDALNAEAARAAATPPASATVSASDEAPVAPSERST